MASAENLFPYDLGCRTGHNTPNFNLSPPPKGSRECVVISSVSLLISMLMYITKKKLQIRPFSFGRGGGGVCVCGGGGGGVVRFEALFVNVYSARSIYIYKW